jgi:hypothetical protein
MKAQGFSVTLTSGKSKGIAFRSRGRVAAEHRVEMAKVNLGTPYMAEKA